MLQKRSLTFIIFFALFILGCGGEHIADAGSHFQNRDCLECHNRDLGSEAALTYGGTLYLDSGSNPDDLSKMCKEQVFVQLISGIDATTIVHDGRNYVSADDPGALGRGNLYLPKKVGSIPAGSHYIRLVLANGTKLAESLLHDFNDNLDTNNTADLNNRYSCNACHSIAPNFTSGLMTAQENISFCLDAPSDVPVATLFEADIYPLLENKCGSCHNDGLSLSNFSIDSSSVSATYSSLQILMIDTAVPTNSALVNCPVDSNHTGIEVCSKTGNAYNRVIDWITLE